MCIYDLHIAITMTADGVEPNGSRPTVNTTVKTYLAGVDLIWHWWFSFLGAGFFHLNYQNEVFLALDKY